MNTTNRKRKKRREKNPKTQSTNELNRYDNNYGKMVQFTRRHTTTEETASLSNQLKINLNNKPQTVNELRNEK